MSHSPSLKVLWGWVMGRTLLMAEGVYPARMPFPRTQIMRFSIIFILLDRFLHLRRSFFHQLMKMTSEMKTFLQGPVIPCSQCEGRTDSSTCGLSTAILKSQTSCFTSCRPVCPTSQPAKPVCAQWGRMNSPLAFLSPIQKVRSSLYYCTLRSKYKIGGYLISWASYHASPHASL